MDPPCKQDAEESASSSLPDELIEDIFARMPAKSAQRCRCLSRAWAATLSSRSFVDRHLLLANRRGSPRLFILPELGTDTDTTMHGWSPGRPMVVLRREERLRGAVSVTTQCRGLVVLKSTGLVDVCFHGDSSCNPDYYVCNPSTGQMTTLPRGKEAFGLFPHNHDVLGIGYDASIQKHKVVRLYCRGLLPPACEVYVLNSSSGHWRPPFGAADRALPPGFARSICTDQSVFAQGHLYWTAQPHRKSNSQRIIISFSISDEVFEILPPPPMDMFPCRITELDGCLCVFNNTDKYKHSYDIWVLRDHRAGTWDLHCRIALDMAPLADTQLIRSQEVIPLGSVDDGSGILLRSDPHSVWKENLEAHRLHVYRPVTGDVEDLLGDDSVTTHHTMARGVAVPYVESLESTGLSDTKRQS
jgi:F-box interacting protein